MGAYFVYDMAMTLIDRLFVSLTFLAEQGFTLVDSSSYSENQGFGFTRTFPGCHAEERLYVVVTEMLAIQFQRRLEDGFGEVTQWQREISYAEWGLWLQKGLSFEDFIRDNVMQLLMAKEI